MRTPNRMRPDIFLAILNTLLTGTHTKTRKYLRNSKPIQVYQGHAAKLDGSIQIQRKQITEIRSDPYFNTRVCCSNFSEVLPHFMKVVLGFSNWR